MTRSLPRFNQFQRQSTLRGLFLTATRYHCLCDMLEGVNYAFRHFTKLIDAYATVDISKILNYSWLDLTFPVAGWNRMPMLAS